MKHLEQIQKTLDYIEENLKTTITLEELSEVAGFSLFHYSRLFHSAVGIGVMQYVTRRRLLWAAYDIAQGCKVIDAALAYGFDTASGFCRAFSRTFGCAPAVYARRFRTRLPYRINLFQEEHLMLSDKKLRSILTNWSLQDAAVVPVVYDSGHISENCFAVADRYYLKLYTTQARVRINIEIAQALELAGIGAAIPVPTGDGSLYVWDGELYFTLTSRIPGEHLPARELLDKTAPVTAWDVGCMIGRLHQVLAGREDIVARRRDIFAEVRDEWFEKVRDVMQLDEAFCDDWFAAVNSFDSLPEQLIHRDPNPANILVQEGKLSGFLDFDLSQRSIRLFDPCYAATGVLCELGDDADEADVRRWIALWHGIRDGYDSVVHLSEEEKRAARYVLLAIQFICVGYFSSVEKFEALARTNIRMTGQLLRHWDEL